MKTRNGFVSNSSSSSFIVAFIGPLPKTIQEMGVLLFGESIDNNNSSKYYDAEKVFKIFQSQTPLTDEETIEEICSGYYDGCPEFVPYYEMIEGKAVPFSEEQMDKMNKEFERKKKEGAVALFKKFMNRFVDAKPKLFIFSYDDECLEDGSPIDRLPHLTISHH